MPREMAVEPVARLATEESVISQKADFNTFTMSNTLSKRIALIIRRIHSGDLLDCSLFATKPPFHPRSSRCPFSECLYTKHFPKHALLDLPRSLMPWGKVHHFRGNSRHFPGGWRRQVRREGAVEQWPDKTRGKVNRICGKARHFPRRWKLQMPREGVCGTGAQT